MRRRRGLDKCPGDDDCRTPRLLFGRQGNLRAPGVGARARPGCPSETRSAMRREIM